MVMAFQLEVDSRSRHRGNGSGESAIPKLVADVIGDRIGNPERIRK